MTKRIAILSDGTGNSAAKVWRTNVWRTFDSIELNDPEQVAFYDDGVGTSSFLPLALLGGMFGYGLKHNVIECYKFLCRNYVPGADIFFFGFSRGAFTVRVLLELVTSQGLPRYEGNEQQLHADALAAYRSYRKQLHTVFRIEAPFRVLRDLIVRTPYTRLKDLPVPPIRFVGLWDTVAAYGLPFEEMTKTVSTFIFPLQLASSDLPKQVERARHALALDDERTTFHPILLTEPVENRGEIAADGFRYVHGQRISQVWFCGVHSNVGGGYPDDALAHIPLSWMMDEAAHYGLQFKKAPRSDPNALRQIHSKQDIDGRLYDSRRGLAAYYRYGPRDLSELYRDVFSSKSAAVPKIHFTVLERISRRIHPYAPLGIPARYEVIGKDGKIYDQEDNKYESPEQANCRFENQLIVWNSVLRRSATYITIVTITAAFFLFPFFDHTPPAVERVSPLRPISTIIRLIGAFIPLPIQFWINSYAKHPALFLVGIVLFAFLQFLNARLKVSISDQMQQHWKDSLEARSVRPKRDLLFLLRTNSALQDTRKLLAGRFIPMLALLIVISITIMLATHFVSSFADAAGLYCKSVDEADAKKLDIGETWKGSFDSSDLCWNSKVWLETNASYALIVTREGRWLAGQVEVDLNGEWTGPSGFEQRIFRTLVFPMRRTLLRAPHSLIARIGSVGNEELFLERNPLKDRSIQDSVSGVIRPGRDGELYLYVNSPVLPIPCMSNYFYLHRNSGTASVVITRKQ